MRFVVAMACLGVIVLFNALTWLLFWGISLTVETYKHEPAHLVTGYNPVAILISVIATAVMVIISIVLQVDFDNIFSDVFK